MNLFLSAAPGSASQTLVSQLNELDNFKNKNPISFKNGNGVGHFEVVCSKTKIKKLKIAEKLNLDLLFYQHLLPNVENLNKLFHLINPDKTFFIFTKRNIFDTSVHFKSRYFNNEPLPYVIKRKLNYRESIYNTILLYSYWLKIMERPYLEYWILAIMKFKKMTTYQKIIQIFEQRNKS